MFVLFVLLKAIGATAVDANGYAMIQLRTRTGAIIIIALQRDAAVDVLTKLGHKVKTP